MVLPWNSLILALIDVFPIRALKQLTVSENMVKKGGLMIIVTCGRCKRIIGYAKNQQYSGIKSLCYPCAVKRWDAQRGVLRPRNDCFI